MAAAGILIVILLTLACAEPRRPNSLRSAHRCEYDTTGLTCGEKYPGIIEIWDIQFPKKIAGVCNNSIHMKNECLASENDKRNLTSELGKYCDGKRICNIHLAHKLYRGIHLPCRDLKTSIQIEIFFDCIYSPVIPKSTHSSTDPSTTESPSVSLQASPNSRPTSSVAETSISISVSEVTITSATTGATTVSITAFSTVERQWSRRRPKTCNYTFEDPEPTNASDSLSPATPIIFSLSWLLVLVKY